jgi:hypothetical protein
MSSYRFQEPSPRTFNVLPAGDYQAVITEAEEPYEKDGKQILKIVFAIQPGGQTVFYYAWTGKTKSGEYRDNIGELLLAANRAPAVGQEPNWSKLKGAKVKVRLKAEPDQIGEERNVIHWVYTPKQAGKPATKQESVSTSEFLKARAKQEIASGGEPEPDDLPYACDRG